MVRLSLVGNRAKDAVDVVRVAEIVDLIARQCGGWLVVYAPARYAIDALCGRLLPQIIFVGFFLLLTVPKPFLADLLLEHTALQLLDLADVLVSL